MNTVAHLFPCMKPVAVSTKQAEVSGVRLPVSEPVIPNASAALVSELHGGVNVVNIKDSVIGLPTGDAFTSQGINQLNLALPVSWMLVFCKSIFIPIILAALFSAKSVFTRGSALLAWLIFAPASREVAVLTAKLSGSILNSVGVYLKFLGAMFTCFRDLSFCSHGLPQNRYFQYSTKYFDIACKRIEQAYAQPDFFVKVSHGDTPTQEELL